MHFLSLNVIVKKMSANLRAGYFADGPDRPHLFGMIVRRPGSIVFQQSRNSAVRNAAADTEDQIRIRDFPDETAVRIIGIPAGKLLFFAADLAD